MANPTVPEQVIELVRREVAEQEVLRDRRHGDRFFEAVIKPLIPWAITGLITSGVLMWVRLAIIDSTMVDLKTEFLSHRAENKIELDSLNQNRDSWKNMQTVMNISLEEIRRRIDEQDKRMQMQGEGLIAGNKSIHDALERLMVLSDNIDLMKKRIERIEPFANEIKGNERRR